jgi:hypothetical protein
LALFGASGFDLFAFGIATQERLVFVLFPSARQWFINDPFLYCDNVLTNKGIEHSLALERIRKGIRIMATDVYTRITEKIVADLERGDRPCMKSWKAGGYLAGKQG